MINSTAPAPPPGARLFPICLGLALLLLMLELPGFETARLASPAAFGHSGPFELFLFFSGWLLAGPLLSAFRGLGVGKGLLRVGHRCWQVYWRYLGAMLVATALVLVLRAQENQAAALAALDLGGLETMARAALLDIALLTEQPAFFGALPAYLLILALAAPGMALGLWRPDATIGYSIVLYGLSQAGLGAPAGWAFDPLAWQLPFFAGFALAAGWLNWRLSPFWIWPSVLLLALSALADPDGALGGMWRENVLSLEEERRLGPLRLLHLGALLFLAWRFGPNFLAQARSAAPGVCEWTARRLENLGRQSLVGLVALHPIAALALSLAAPAETGALFALLAPLAIAASLLLAAEVALWFASPPWARARLPA